MCGKKNSENAGVYNVLSSCGRRDLTIKQFLDNINRCDISTEASLLTILQSVRGTKQIWYLRKSDIMAMIREYGSPTLFLTFSCAEYDSPEIERYLNNVSSKYSMPKLCAISVSRKFSQKFHEFFSAAIVKGKVLGCVTHYFGRKNIKVKMHHTIMF